MSIEKPLQQLGLSRRVLAEEEWKATQIRKSALNMNIHDSFPMSGTQSINPTHYPATPLSHLFSLHLVDNISLWTILSPSFMLILIFFIMVVHAAFYVSVFFTLYISFRFQFCTQLWFYHRYWNCSSPMWQIWCHHGGSSIVAVSARRLCQPPVHMDRLVPCCCAIIVLGCWPAVLPPEHLQRCSLTKQVLQTLSAQVSVAPLSMVI